MLEIIIIASCAYGVKCDLMLNTYSQLNSDFRERTQVIENKIKNRLGEYNLFIVYSTAALNAYLSNSPIPFKVTPRTTINISTVDNSIMVVWSYGF